MAGRTAPVSAEGQGPKPPSPPPVRPSGRADKRGHRFWSCSSRPVPSPGPGSSALLVPLDMRTAPQGVVRPSSRASPLPEEPRTAPSGEIVLGILQIWNCSALISLFQLVCPTLAPRAGPCPAVSLGGRGLALSSTGISQPQRKAGFTWAPSSPQRRGLWPEDLAPPLLLQASNSSFFPVPYTWSVAQSLRYGDLMCTHPCPVSPMCDPFSCPTPVPLHESRTG